MRPGHSGAGKRIRTADRPLTRSFLGQRRTAAFLVSAVALAVWLPLDVRGFRPVLARGWHGPCVSMRTTAVHLFGWWRSSVCSSLRVADVGERRGGLLYSAAVSLAQTQVGADRLCLEAERAPELVAGVRCIATQRRPVVLAVPILAATARLDVVLSHETDHVGDLNRHVATVIMNVGYRGDPIARPLDLRPGEPMVVGQETQAIGRYLNERRSFPHEGSFPRLGPCRQLGNWLVMGPPTRTLQVSGILGVSASVR
jgi:hypothetical protein